MAKKSNGKRVTIRKSSAKPAPGQQPLPGAIEEQTGPALVVNGRMLCEYVKPHFTRDKDDDRFVSLEFSTKLTEAHSTVLPRSVLGARDFISNGHSEDGTGNKVEGIPVKPQTVRIFLTSDTKDEELMIVGATITHAKVQIVEERGNGEAVKFLRYSFRVMDERSKNILNFACWNDGRAVWLESRATQESLLS